MYTDADIDRITQSFRMEDSRRRRLTVLLTLIPIGVGVVVIACALWRVNIARQDLKAVAEEKLRLGEEVAGLRTAREKLDAEVVQLNSELEARQAIFKRYQSQLPQAAVQLDQALGYSQKGDYANAIQTYRKVVSADPGNDLAYNGLGYVYLQDQQYTQGIANLERALRIDSSNPEAHYNLSLAYWKVNDPKRAAAELMRSIQLDASLDARSHRDPEFKPIRDAMELMEGEGSARSEAEKALIDEGLRAAKRGRFEEAVGAYDRALAINPSNAKVRNWRGYSLYRSNKYTESVESLREAVRLDPGFAEAYYNLGLALWSSVQRDEAAAAVKRCFDLDPQYRAKAEQDPNSRRLLRYLSDNPS